MTEIKYIPERGEAFDRAHVIHLGMGGNRKTGRGKGCNCSINILCLSRYYHDVLDGRTTNYDLEHYMIRFKKLLSKHPRVFRHKIAFGATFGYSKQIGVAIRHYKLRLRGKTECSKGR